VQCAVVLLLQCFSAVVGLICTVLLRDVVSLPDWCSIPVSLLIQCSCFVSAMAVDFRDARPPNQGGFWGFRTSDELFHWRRRVSLYDLCRWNMILNWTCYSTPFPASCIAWIPPIRTWAQSAYFVQIYVNVLFHTCREDV